MLLSESIIQYILTLAIYLNVIVYFTRTVNKVENTFLLCYLYVFFFFNLMIHKIHQISLKKYNLVKWFRKHFILGLLFKSVYVLERGGFLCIIIIYIYLLIIFYLFLFHSFLVDSALHLICIMLNFTERYHMVCTAHLNSNLGRNFQLVFVLAGFSVCLRLTLYGKNATIFN